jgi:hypothetical protein
MLKKITFVLAATLAASSFCLAQTAPAKDNSHRSYDQRARDCKKQAIEQQLSAEEQRAFITACMKA